MTNEAHKAAGTFEDLVRDLGDARRIPRRTLEAVAVHAEKLEARLIPLAEKFVAGVWLSPAEANILLYGLHVLAAERRTGFAPHWYRLLGAGEVALDSLFGDGLGMAVAPLSLGFCGDDVDTLMDMAQRPDLSDLVREGLVDALAYTCATGWLERAAYLALIDRLASIAPDEHDDRYTFSVESGIVLGGLAERETLLRAVRARDAFRFDREIDRVDALERLKAAAADPGDLARFHDIGAAPPASAIEALKWLENIERHDKRTTKVKPLSWREREWLNGFLKGTPKPEATMGFEELDGFYHALAISPDLVPPSEFLPVIWGEGPVFNSDREARAVMDLLMRHWNSVVEDLSAGRGFTIALDADLDAPVGSTWARGFAAGYALRRMVWDFHLALIDDGDQALYDILSLADVSSAAERDALLSRLESNLGALSQMRDADTDVAPAPAAPKVGRNDPCPCGSGRKWKKCCGGAPTTLH